MKNRKRKSVLDSTYQYIVGDVKANIWVLLSVSCYSSSDSSNFLTNDEEKWLQTQRQTRLRMRRHVDAFLCEQKRIGKLDDVVKRLSQLAAVTERDISYFPQETDGFSCEEIVRPSEAETEAISSANKLVQERCSSHSEQQGITSTLENFEASNWEISTSSHHNWSAESNLPAEVFNFDPGKFIPVSGESSLFANPFHTSNQRRLRLSELFNSFVVENNISHTAADRFIIDVKKEKPLNDLETVACCFKNRARLPKARTKRTFKRGLVGFRDEGNGRCYHFGLFAQMKRHLPKVMEATFGDGPKPKVPCIYIDAWTDGASIAKTGKDVELYPVAARFIAIGEWHNNPSERKFVAVPDDMAFMPFTVAVFLGPNKPAHCSIILRRFVYELRMLDPRDRDDRNDNSPSGLGWLTRRTRHFTVSLLWFLADTIARQLVKHIRPFSVSSDGGCEACTADGVKFHQRMATSRFDMTEEGLELREDSKWHQYTSHYNHTFKSRRSPLEQLKYFGMVSCVPPEEMHTLYKLIWKHVMELVIDRDLKPSSFSVFGVLRTDIFKARLRVISELFTPCEFERNLGDSDDVGSWKCTQLRQFGLYCSDSSIEGLVSERCLVMVRYLKVFNMLLLGMKGQAPSSQDLDLAQMVIEYVVTEYMKLAKLMEVDQDNVPSVPYCIHLALHLVRYVRKLNVSYGKISAFAYENFIRDLLPPVRSTNCMLEQIVNRQKRREMYILNRNRDGSIMRNCDGEPVVGWGGWKGNYKLKNPSGLPFVYSPKAKHSVLEFEKFEVSTNFSDSWVLICSNHSDASTFSKPLIFRCVEFVAPQQEMNTSIEISGIFMRGYFYPYAGARYTEPFPSTWKLEFSFPNEPNPSLAQVCVESIIAKMYVFPRFSAMKAPFKCLTKLDLGENFSDVVEWVGMALRH